MKQPKLKICDLGGGHLVPILWRSRTKIQESACKNCYFSPLNTELVRKKIVSQGGSNSVRKPVDKVSGNEIPKLLSQAEQVFNSWIRSTKGILIGDRFCCISCGDWKDKKLMQAGHFMSKTFSSTRFLEDNVWPECVGCNCMNPDHLIPFRKNIIDLIGIERVEYVEQLAKQSHKWSLEELLSIIEKYKL